MHWTYGLVLSVHRTSPATLADQTVHPPLLETPSYSSDDGTKHLPLRVSSRRCSSFCPYPSLTNTHDASLAEHRISLYADCQYVAGSGD